MRWFIWAIWLMGLTAGAEVLCNQTVEFPGIIWGTRNAADPLNGLLLGFRQSIPPSSQIPLGVWGAVSAGRTPFFTFTFGAVREDISISNEGYLKLLLKHGIRYRQPDGTRKFASVSHVGLRRVSKIHSGDMTSPGFRYFDYEVTHVGVVRREWNPTKGDFEICENASWVSLFHPNSEIPNESYLLSLGQRKTRNATHLSLRMGERVLPVYELGVTSEGNPLYGIRAARGIEVFEKLEPYLTEEIEPVSDSAANGLDFKIPASLKALMKMWHPLDSVRPLHIEMAECRAHLRDSGVLRVGWGERVAVCAKRMASRAVSLVYTR